MTLFYVFSLNYLFFLGGDLSSQNPFDGDNVQNDVGVFLPRGRAGFTKTTGHITI